MSYIIRQQVKIHVEEAPCGHWTVLTEEQRVKGQEEGDSFYCTLGHGWHYATSDNQRLRAELAEAQEIANKARLAEQMALKRAEMVEAESRRLQKRITNGVCPYCRRSFQNVARHMESKHKERE